MNPIFRSQVPPPTPAPVPQEHTENPCQNTAAFAQQVSAETQAPGFQKGGRSFTDPTESVRHVPRAGAWVVQTGLPSTLVRETEMKIKAIASVKRELRGERHQELEQKNKNPGSGRRPHRTREASPMVSGQPCTPGRDGARLGKWRGEAQSRKGLAYSGATRVSGRSTEGWHTEATGQGLDVLQESWRTLRGLGGSQQEARGPAVQIPLAPGLACAELGTNPGPCSAG